MHDLNNIRVTAWRGAGTAEKEGERSLRFRSMKERERGGGGAGEVREGGGPTPEKGWRKKDGEGRRGRTTVERS